PSHPASRLFGSSLSAECARYAGICGYVPTADPLSSNASACSPGSTNATAMALNRPRIPGGSRTLNISLSYEEGGLLHGRQAMLGGSVLSLLRLRSDHSAR